MFGATGKTVGTKSMVTQEDDLASQRGAEDGTVQSPDLGLQESKIMWVLLLLLCPDMLFISVFRRRVDWRMLPLLGLLYAIALIDRTNLGIARAAGMDRDLVCTSLSLQF
jgi:hypothetical protein